MAVLSGFATYSAIVEGYYPNTNLWTMEDSIRLWGWEVWAIIALLFLFVCVLLVANDYRRKLETNPNFIIAGKAKTGKTPPVPKSLLKFVSNYKEGKPISEKIELRDPSLQEWRGLTEDNKNRYLNIKEYLGQDQYDFLQGIEDGRPPDGDKQSFRLHRKDTGKPI